jgi:YihY family inner membrane protein
MQTSVQNKTESKPQGGLFKQILKRFEGFINKFNNDWTMQSAGALAYNLMVSIVPIGLAIVAIAGFAIGALSPDAKTQFLNGITHAFPSSNFSQGILEVVFNSLNRSAVFLTILAVITSVFGGSRLFLSIEACFDITYRTYTRNVVAQNIMAILMMLLFIVLVPLMVLASSLPAILLSLVQNSALDRFSVINFLTHNSFILGAIGILTSLVVCWILFEAILIFVPNQKISFKNSWRGALLSAVLLELFLALFPLYITHFMGSYIGTAVFTIILLVFFYYFAVILLLGAEVNAYFAEHIQPLPNNLAAVLHDAIVQKGDGADSTTTVKHVSDQPQKAESPVKEIEDLLPRPEKVKSKGSSSSASNA